MIELTESTLNLTATTLSPSTGPALQRFCDTPFWDPALTWWTNVPDITPCFQYTIVRLLPCLWFWLFMPFKLWRYRSDKESRKLKCAYSTLTVIKISACALLAMVSFGEVIQSVALYAAQVAYRSTSQFLSPALELVTVVWVGIVIRHERRHGYVACGVVWLYWLLASLCYALVTYSAVINFTRTWPEPQSFLNGTVVGAAKSISASRWNVDICLLMLVSIRFIVSLLAFGLACVADHKVDPTLLQNDSLATDFGGHESFELSAGFLSRLLYAWVFRILRRGASKPIEAADLCSLSPIDRSAANTPQFERVYYAAVSAWRSKQRELGRTADGGSSKNTSKRGSLKQRKSEGHASDERKQAKLDVAVNGHEQEKLLYDVDANLNPKLTLVMNDDEADTPLAATDQLLNHKNIGIVEGEGITKSSADGFSQQDDPKTPLHLADGAAIGSTKKRYAVASDAPQKKSAGLFRIFSKHGKQKAKEPSGANTASTEQKSEFILDKTEYPSALSSLLRVYWKDIVKSHLFKLVQDVVLFSNTALVALLIRFAEDPERFDHVWRGVLFALTLAFNQILQSVTLQQTFHIGFRCGLHMRTALTTALYRKALTVSNASRNKAALGELVNLMAVDAKHIQDVMGYSWAFWSCPTQIVVACALIWSQMGVATLAGLATLIFFFTPINAVVATQMRKLQMAQMTVKDERIKQVNELLAGIRLVKLYAWEVPFRRRVAGARDRELQILRRTAMLAIVQNFVFNFAPFLVTVVTFAVYVATSDQELTAQRAFVTLNLFQVLRFPMGILPIIVQFSVTAVVAVRRISRFLAQPDLNEANVTHEPNEAEPITLDGASFGWSAANEKQPANDNKQQTILRDVTLHVRRGELLAVVGRVGAGKSTLVSAILGETELFGGRVNVSGRVAYIAQQSWIQNASLRDNVLFGAAFDEEKYRRVLSACALDADLAMLPGGDQTEIGEKGINLSGGQKQRVALARALYADVDLYLLDDPLSAVDVHVGRHIFDRVVGPNGLLRNKTRVFVTHGLHWLRNCDRVAVIDPASKRIVQLGPYDELIAAPDSFLLNHLHLESDRDAAATDANQGDETSPTSPPLNTELSTGQLKSTDTELTDLSSGGSVERQSSIPAVATAKKSPPQTPTLMTQKSMTREEEQEAIRAAIKKREEEQKLIQEEKSQTGRVKLKVYLTYFRAQPLLLFAVYAFVQAIAYALSIVADWWVALWTEDQLLIGNPAAIITNLTDFVTDIPTQMWTTSTTIVNSTDSLAKEARDAVRSHYMAVYASIGVVIACVFITSATLSAIGSLRASRVLHAKMLDRILHAPMHFFDTTPTGRIVNRFSKDIELVDTVLAFAFRSWTETFYSVVFTIVGVCVGTPLVVAVIIPAVTIYYFVQRFFISTSRQLKRLESTSSSPVITYFAESLQGASTIRAFGARERFVVESQRRIDRNNVFCFLGLVANRWISMYLEIISAIFVAGAAIFCVITSVAMSTTGGRVGLSLTYALTIAQTLSWMMHMNSEIETNIVSVERIQEYAEVQEEPQWERTEADLVHDGVRLSSEWPTQGEIQFDSYATRYRENLGLVLRDLTLRVKPGEKVGIVGRTGAGKSSFTLALFRMIEAANGRIVVDGVDISRLGVHQLRSKLTILPQDPIIFAGSLRANLDPFEAYTDEQVWRALELAGLREHFTQNDGLRYECTEGGSNLSVGQRQLVCLARALLRKTKVLVLDEATAAVDLRTDELIQRTIRTAFADCTVLTIAHRLNTIMDYDRILVLDRGAVAEFDSPAALLARPDSVFASMVRQADASH